MAKKLTGVLLAVLILNGICAAAAPVNPDDFIGTSWILWGSAKFSSKVLSGSAKCFSGVYFDTSDRIHFFDEEGYDISGGYNFDSEGNLVIDVTEQDMEDFFDEYLSDTFPFTVLDDWDVDVISTSSSAKVSYSGDRVTLAVSISMKANIYIEYEGERYDVKLTFATKLAGDHPINNASWASKWALNGKMKLGAKKVKAEKPLNLELTIGDYDASGLELFQYVLFENSSVLPSSILGDFCRTKNKLLFHPSDSDVEALIEDVISENGENVSYVTVYGSYVTITASIKDKQKITLSGTIKFLVYIEYDDGSYEEDVKGTLKLSGKGVPAP